MSDGQTIASLKAVAVGIHIKSCVSYREIGHQHFVAQNTLLYTVIHTRVIPKLPWSYSQIKVKPICEVDFELLPAAEVSVDRLRHTHIVINFSGNQNLVYLLGEEK